MVVLSSSLVGRHLGKSIEVALNNFLSTYLFSIVGCLFFITCFISLYSTLSVNLRNIHFVIYVYQRVVSFPCLPLGSNTQ